MEDQSKCSQHYSLAAMPLIRGYRPGIALIADHSIARQQMRFVLVISVTTKFILPSRHFLTEGSALRKLRPSAKGKRSQYPYRAQLDALCARPEGPCF